MRELFHTLMNLDKSPTLLKLQHVLARLPTIPLHFSESLYLIITQKKKEIYFLQSLPMQSLVRSSPSCR